MVIKMRYIDLVNIKMGTHSVCERSCGNTNPLMARPFGANHYLPQTRDNERWMYHPDDVRFFGIRLTHIPSPWMGDYLKLLMMPTCGSKSGAAVDGNSQSSYDAENAKLTPAYMDLYLIRYGIRLEFTPTLHGGYMRVKWHEKASEFVNGGERRGFLLNYSGIDKGGENCSIDFKNGKIFGYTNNFRQRGAENAAKDLKLYFVFELGAELDEESSVLSHGVVNLAFKGSPENASIRFATSFISTEQAEYNLEREIGKHGFDELRSEAEAEWEGYLSKIEIQANDAVKRTFYSCLYRSFLFPREFHEHCPDGKIRHFAPECGGVFEGPMYVDNGFWDTYKTVYPLYSLIASDRYREMCEGFVNFYKEGGWLPRWTSPCAVNCMPGTAIDAVFGDAAVKGVVTDEKLLRDMLESLLKHSENVSSSPAYGRDGLEAFISLGYVSDEYHESVNKTLDYAYGDFCISRVADALGEKEISARLRENAKKYRNLFDAETGFMRARNREGKMREDFSEFDWGGDYTEGGAWQNSFAVYQDLLGYAELLGGREKFLSMIQRLFDMPAFFKEKGYSSEIHEMTEMFLQGGFGQCALSNQPSFHVPYLFSCMGDRDRSAYWVRKCTKELFKAEPKGFPGDEDNGSMATWYVFSALGFYPVCPGVDEYVFGSPCVDSAILHLDNGKAFKILAVGNDDDNIYASDIRLNGQKMLNVVIKQSEIKNGGELDFTMNHEPSMQYYNDDQLPYSMSKKA